MRRTLIIGTLLVFFSASISCAQEKPAEEKKLPRTGNLAGTTSAGSVDFVGNDDAYGGQLNDIGGSVSKVRPGRFTVRVFNNSESDTYSAHFVLKHLNVKGERIKSESFSYTLAPKKTAERTVSTGPLTDNMMLSLDSVKSVGSTKKDEAAGNS